MSSEDAQDAEKVALTDAEREALARIISQAVFPSSWVQGESLNDWDGGALSPDEEDYVAADAVIASDWLADRVAEAVETFAAGAATLRQMSEAHLIATVERERAAWAAKIEALARDGERTTYNPHTVYVDELRALLDGEVTP